MEQDPDRDIYAEVVAELAQALEKLASEVTLEGGETLFEHGDEGDALFFVSEGRLEVSVLSSDGRKLILDVMGPGTVLGEITLFDPGPRTASVAAIGPTRLRRVRNADLLREIHRDPEIATPLIRLAGQRMRRMSGQVSEQVFLPMSVRLARRLLYLSDGNGGDRLSMPQAQLAQFVGATREAVSKTLNEWKRDGIVSASRGGIELLDRPALRRIAESGLI